MSTTDLQTALLRLGQAEQRLAERFPRVARDPRLASALSGVRDALGVFGPAEEADPEPGRKPDIFRRQIAPDLAVVTEADGAAVVLEISDGLGGHVLRGPAISHLGDFRQALDDAQAAQRAVQDQAAVERARRLVEPRRGAKDRMGAVEYLVAKGMVRPEAAGVVRRAKLDRPDPPERVRPQYGTVYDVTYVSADNGWHVTEVPESER